MGQGLIEVGSAEIAKYEDMVKAHARRLARMPGLENHQDDFVQEGLIAVWESLQAGRPPSNLHVLSAMRTLAQKERRRGMSGYDENPDGSWTPKFEALSEGLEDPRS